MKKTNQDKINDMLDELIEAAHLIVKHKIFLAIGDQNEKKGEEDFQPEAPILPYRYQEEHANWVMEMVEPHLAKAQILREIEMNNSSQVMGLMASGKITLKEAQQLVSLMRVQIDTAELEQKAILNKKLLGIIGDI